MTSSPLLEARQVSKRFPLPGGGGEFRVLELVGRSGCGKSTLLRILAGLIPASEGEVCYRGRPVAGPCPGVAMVFQSFALLPWLDVLGNVELGLKARGMPPEARRDKALRNLLGRALPATHAAGGCPGRGEAGDRDGPGAPAADDPRDTDPCGTLRQGEPAFARVVLPRAPGAAFQPGRGPAPARHGDRLGALRRALWLRGRHQRAVHRTTLVGRPTIQGKS